nr:MULTISPECIES: class I SAM-dependent methyltransferase [unclassified Leucobacter]
MSAHEWYVNGVDVPSLGVRIHPHYGTFMPTRHEYVDLVASEPLPAHDLAFDIGTGTGVHSAVLAKRGIRRVIGTDLQRRAVDCATENFELLGIADVAEARICDMFPDGKASLIVCNPPWLPGSAATSFDAAIYDPGSQMLLDAIAPAGLEVISRLDTTPAHCRASDATDVLHAARSREVTSLWRLRVAATAASSGAC